MQKNESQISCFALMEKAPESLKKIFFKKKSFQLICADKVFKTMDGTFFKINWSPGTELLVILRFRKIVFQNEIINVT